jgi:hypothetical protein
MKPSLDSAIEASANLEAEEHLETDRPTVKYRLYKRRFAGLVALVSRGLLSLFSTSHGLTLHL